jgi:GNAT superfamily N-acetyltransferase
MPEVERPETTRPRRDPAADTDASPPPARGELLAIERGLADLAELAGAALSHVPPRRAVPPSGGQPTAGYVDAATPATHAGAPSERIDLEPPAGMTLARWPGRGVAFNHATLVRWTASSCRDEIDDLTVRLREAGEEPAIVVAAGLTTPADLGVRLRSAGWTAILAERVLWTRRAGIVPHLDPAMRIEAVTAASAATYEFVERAIFELPASDAADRTAALERALGSRVRAYLVRTGRDPVATARLASLEGLACLHGIGVVRARRRQGFGSLITTIVTRAGLATGHPLAWLSVSERNRAAVELYESLEYRPSFSWELFVGPG